MSTLSQLITRISNDLHRTDLTTQIREAINRAIQHYGRERWWFLEQSYVFTTSSTSTYSVPLDLIQIDSIKATILGCFF